MAWVFPEASRSYNNSYGEIRDLCVTVMFNIERDSRDYQFTAEM
jgi:hypothetical protein